MKYTVIRRVHFQPYPYLSLTKVFFFNYKKKNKILILTLHTFKKKKTSNILVLEHRFTLYIFFLLRKKAGF